MNELNVSMTTISEQDLRDNFDDYLKRTGWLAALGVAESYWFSGICRGGCASSCTAGGRQFTCTCGTGAGNCRQNWRVITAIPNEPDLLRNFASTGNL